MLRRNLGKMAAAAGLVACLAAAAAGSRPVGVAASRARPASLAVTTARTRPAPAGLGRVLRAVQALHLPGAVIGVTGDGRANYELAFGRARPGRIMTLGDHFRIGSITKTFTATLILELVDRHRLRLTDRISAWEPRVPDARRITIGMLLDMRSGIWDEGGTGPGGRPSLLSRWAARYCTGHDPVCGRTVWKPQQIVNLAIRQGRAYPPGTWYYSDTNYVILGIIAQDVMHEPLARMMRRLVLDPLHLHQTSFPVSTLAIPRPATAGYLGNARGQYRLADVMNPSANFAFGNMISTLPDLQRWARDLADGALLTRRTARVRDRAVLTPDAAYPLAGSGVTTGLVVRYGLGLVDLSNLIGHNGFVPPSGYSAEMWALPHGRGTVVELFNSITLCDGGTEYVADAVNASLAQAAFGPHLYRVAVPEIGCPAGAAHAQTSPVRS
jgi:D-alanyl-D-alanine carboxypeptidase